MKKIMILFITIFLLFGCAESRKTEIYQDDNKSKIDEVSEHDFSDVETKLDKNVISEIEKALMNWERLDGTNRFSRFLEFDDIEETEYTCHWIDLETYEYWRYWWDDPYERVVYNYKENISTYKGCEFDFESKKTSGECSNLTDKRFKRLFEIKKICFDYFFNHNFEWDFTVEDFCTYRPE